MIGKFVRAGIASSLLIACSGLAHATSRYDGAWDLTFVTQRGVCDASYNFGVRITKGIVSHPNLVRFTGRVRANGAVVASVIVGNRSAAGDGKLTLTSGRGRWSGYSGAEKCSGYWVGKRA